jgi:NUMOD1 domain
MSEEFKQKCIKHTRPVTLYNLNGTIYGEFSTIIDAAKAINCNENNYKSFTDRKKISKKTMNSKRF